MVSLNVGSAVTCALLFDLESGSLMVIEGGRGKLVRDTVSADDTGLSSSAIDVTLDSFGVIT